MSKKPSQKASIDKISAQSILRSVPYNEGFHFFTAIGAATGGTAVDLFGFYEELREVDLTSVRFHFQREDFQNWFATTLGDIELALEIEKINPKQSDEKLKEELVRLIGDRLTMLYAKAQET